MRELKFRGLATDEDDTIGEVVLRGYGGCIAGRNILVELFYEVEVIGNIYENPDLLETKNV